MGPFPVPLRGEQALSRTVEQNGCGGRSVSAAREDPMAKNNNPELESRIRNDVHDLDAYVAYAEWLRGRGDKRGELAMLQHAGRAEEAKAFLAKHDYLLGALKAFGNAPDPQGRHWSAEWRCGFIHKLWLDWGNSASGLTRETSEKELRSILSQPATQFLAELHLGPAPYTRYLNGPGGFMSTGSLFDVLCTLEVRNTLETLSLGNLLTAHGYLYPNLTDTAAGSLYGLWRLPRLRRLYVRAGEVRLDRGLGKSMLRELVIHTHGLTREHMLNPLLETQWPALETLELWFGDPPRDACDVSVLAPILSGQAMPALKRLGLGNCPWADDLAKVLPGAKILPNLSMLDLSRGALHDEGVQELAKHAAAFQHLQELDLRNSALSEEGITLARTLNKNVLLEDQDPQRGRSRNYATCAVMQ